MGIIIDILKTARCIYLWKYVKKSTISFQINWIKDIPFSNSIARCYIISITHCNYELPVILLFNTGFKQKRARIYPICVIDALRAHWAVWVILLCVFYQQYEDLKTGHYTNSSTFLFAYNNWKWWRISSLMTLILKRNMRQLEGDFLNSKKTTAITHVDGLKHWTRVIVYAYFLYLFFYVSDEGIFDIY